MSIEQITVDNEQRTCLPTLYGKALDARAADPILGDTLAAEAVDRIDFDFRTLHLPKNGAITLPIRAKHLDGWTREFLTDHPAATVLNLGCGLDTRVHRIDPPASVRWYDVDRPSVIDVRERLYPARDGYRMIGASVTDPAWPAEVATDLPVLVVGEGLLQYLPEPDAYAFFNRITGAFPGGQFVFDAYGRLTTRVITFASKFSKVPVRLGMSVDDPHALEAAVTGLTLMDAVPFLTLPELVDRLATGPASRAVYRTMSRMRWYRNSMLHLRYRF